MEKLVDGLGGLSVSYVYAFSPSKTGHSASSTVLSLSLTVMGNDMLVLPDWRFLVPVKGRSNHSTKKETQHSWKFVKDTKEEEEK